MSEGGKGGSKLKKMMSMSPSMVLRYLKAKQLCKKENRELKPKDLFTLKGFVCAGTDNRCYKDDLEDLWGVRPIEVFSGPEPSCLGIETWSRNGLYFFPDTCFYEFMPRRKCGKIWRIPPISPGPSAWTRYRRGKCMRSCSRC